MSEVYNVVTGMRIHLSSLSSSSFVEAKDETQVYRLRRIAMLLEEEMARIGRTTQLLEAASRQGFWSYLFNCPRWQARLQAWRRRKMVRIANGRAQA